MFKLFSILILLSGTVTGADKLRLCSTADWPPYESFNPKTQAVEGISAGLVQQIAKELGFEPQIQSMPWERCLDQNKNGQMDGVFSVSKNDEREKFLIYPKEDMIKVSYTFVTLKGIECKWCEGDKNLLSLPQPLGGPHGYSIVKKLKDEAPSLVLDDAGASDQVNLEKLLAGRLKSIVISTDVFNNLVAGQEYKDKLVVTHPPYVDKKPYYMAVSRKYKGSEAEAQKLADQIAGAIQKIRAMKA